MGYGQVVVLVFIAAVVGPAIIARVIVKSLSEARREDWSRQDQVAARVEAVREAVIESDAQVARVAAENNAAVSSKLEQIHTLVNSELTASQERALRADRASLQALKEVVALKAERGLDPDPESLVAIEDAQRRVDKLAHELEHKAEQTRVADERRAADDARTGR
jgi:hypothetical protein